MDRRTFIGAVAAGILASPLAASAQTATTVRRIGVLSSGAPTTPAELQQIYAPFRELGWIEGQNLFIERRYANGRAELLRPLTAGDPVRSGLVAEPGSARRQYHRLFHCWPRA
jgi:putative ABC transport system substrate-binding protein